MENLGFSDVAYLLVKVTTLVFMVIHILAIFILVRQAMLASKVVETGGNSRVLLFSFLHAILLVVILLVILILPKI